MREKEGEANPQSETLAKKKKNVGGKEEEKTEVASLLS